MRGWLLGSVIAIAACGGPTTPVEQPPAREPVPVVRIPEPTVGPALHPDVIRRVMKRDIETIRACFALATTTGSPAVEFTIAADGTVASVSAAGLPAPIATCVADVIRTIRFPPLTGGGTMIVRYPIVFPPA